MNLHLFQLADSALPIGGYGHSWGLEAAVSRGVVSGPSLLRRWVRLWLHHSLGPLEGVVVGSACRAVHAQNWAGIREANDLLQLTLTPDTLRHASLDLGGQLVGLALTWGWCRSVARDVFADRTAAPPGSPPRWHHAAVFGALAASAGAAPEEAVAVYAHQSAIGVISAGVRSIPIGHTHGQEVLARLHDDIVSVAAEVCDRDLSMAGASCPAYEACCYEQTRLYTRLFRS